MIVATLAGGYDIHPAVFATLAERMYMVSGKQEMRELFTAIETQVLVASEQGFVA